MLFQNDLIFKLILKTNTNSNQHQHQPNLIPTENIVYVYDDSSENILKNILFKFENVMNRLVLEKAIQSSSSIFSYSNLNFIWLSLFFKKIVYNLSDDYIIQDEDVEILIFIFNKKYLNVSNSLNVSLSNCDPQKVSFFDRLVFMNYSSFHFSHSDIKTEMNSLCNRLSFNNNQKRNYFCVSKTREDIDIDIDNDKYNDIDEKGRLFNCDEDSSQSIDEKSKSDYENENEFVEYCQKKKEEEEEIQKGKLRKKEKRTRKSNKSSNKLIFNEDSEGYPIFKTVKIEKKSSLRLKNSNILRFETTKLEINPYLEGSNHSNLNKNEEDNTNSQSKEWGQDQIQVPKRKLSNRLFFISTKN